MRRHFTPSMVVAVIALFVALSGTAVAAKHALITGAQIKDHSIGYVDLSNVAIAKLRGHIGPVGPQGADGAQGPAGPPGAAGPAGPAGTFSSANVQVISAGPVTLNPGSGGQATATCPAGTKLIGGGMITGAAYIASAPEGNGWLAGAFDESSSLTATVTAYAICGS